MPLLGPVIPKDAIVTGTVLRAPPHVGIGRVDKVVNLLGLDEIIDDLNVSGNELRKRHQEETLKRHHGGCNLAMRSWVGHFMGHSISARAGLVGTVCASLT